MSALLELKNVDAAYGQTNVLHGLNLTVAAGGVTALLGANGAGKTTTLRAICNILVKTAGAIVFDGRRIDGLVTPDIVRLGIAHIPDGRGTFVDMTIEENLRMGAYTRKGRAFATESERVYGYFPRLKERRLQQAGTLSGGEQQMLAISRALMLRPRLLLLDEPSFGLAPQVVAEIFRILENIRRTEAMSMLLVEQHADLALELADHAFVMETGRVVMQGPAAQVRQDDAVRRAYLG